ncbi:hypothetical protein [Sphingomonas sp.]|uniref:hypothetical protein n=1 Tax=Sphingomonas sp. TaxID=28214 RepID=UPI00182A3B21|nr:hypothetical protein [Sphingomonas sp.]MBA3512198.1 hypothetical protein [Sphingomonas sp.]
MTARNWLLGIAPALAATGAMAAQPAPAGALAAPSEATKKVAECEGEKFEFTAGDTRPTKITLCSDKGADKDDLVRMFESAATKIEQLEKLPQDRRAALVAQLKAKIIEVRARDVFISPLPAAGPPPGIRPEIGPTPEYAQLPPLPLPVRAPVVAAPSLAPGIALTKPNLTLECSTPGEIGEGGPCIAFARDTLLTIRADEALGGDTSLRFVRRGDVRAELALAQMRKGQTRRIRLPSELCAGVTGSNIEIQVVRSAGSAASLGQVVDTRGPYQLRC